MISAATGEVTFRKLQIAPQGILAVGLERTKVELPFPGCAQYFLEPDHSEWGEFDIQLLCDAERRVEMAFLSHLHPFYDEATPEDEERRAFHEGIVHIDLRGQREFSWGEVINIFSSVSRRDWLVVCYDSGPHVPRRPTDELLNLLAKKGEPAEIVEGA